MRTHNDPYKALRSRNYALFLLGSVLDIMGNQMQAIAVGWELYLRTHSAYILGFVGLVQFLPVLLFALPIGHAADKYDRKMLVFLSEVLTVLAAVGLAALSFMQGPISLYYVCLFVLGISRSLNMTSRSSILPSLVPREDITNAITWNSNGRQVATIVGPGVGGLLIAATGGVFWVYVIDALSSLAFIGLLLPVKIPRIARSEEPMSVRSLSLGLKFIAKTKIVLATITLDLFAVLLGGAITLLPVFATDILHVGATGLGWLRAAPSVGAMVTAFFIARFPMKRRVGLILLIAVMGFGASTILFGISRVFWFSLAMLLLTGAFDTVSVVIRGTLVQMLTPNELLGRVSAVNAIFISSSNELGGFESGVTAQLFGAVPSVVGGGIGTILVVIAVAWLWPQILFLSSLDGSSSHRLEKMT